MTIELLVGIAMGYIPCRHYFPLLTPWSWSYGNEVVDNFGTWQLGIVHVVLLNSVFVAHLGGFLMGLLVGTTFYPVISVTRRHRLIMWGFRLVAIPLAVILYIVLVRNFYTSDPYAGASLSQVFGKRSITGCCSVFWVSLSVMLPDQRKQSLSRVSWTPDRLAGADL